MELLDFAAENIRAGHALHREKARLERPIDERAQVAARHFFRDEPDLQKVHRRGGERRHRRRADAVGELFRERAELFRERLPREVNVRILLENGGYDAESLDAFRAHGIQIRRAVHRALDWPRDQNFDLLRAQPRRLRLDRDLRRDELGKHIERRTQGDVAAPRQQRDGERDDDAAMADGKLDDEAEHSEMTSGQ